MGNEPKRDEPKAQPAISFGQRDRGPALFLRDGPEGLEDRVPGFEQREQRFGRDMGFADAARLARDRLLPLVVPDRHAAGPLSVSGLSWPCLPSARSAVRRSGKEFVRTVNSRWLPYI